jgi:hypothetical protein
MFETDFDDFAALLDAAYSLHPRTPALPAVGKAMFFRAMAAYPLEVVRASIDAHVKDSQRGQFPPKPADLIAQIEGAADGDGRPGQEETWAIAVQAFDESATVMMTDEIAEAQSIARPIFEIGDEVGARMAFREAYTRIIGQVRSAGVPVRWWPSLGSDRDGRREVMERAVSQGLLPANAPVVSGILSAPEKEVPLLEAFNAAAPSKEEARATFDTLLKMLERDPEADEQRRLARVEAERNAVDARKAELRQQAESIGLTDGGYDAMRGTA